MGFGRALTAALVEDGFDVVVDARGADALAATAAALGPRVHPVVGDVADPAHRARLVEPATLADLFATNVVAPLALCQLALPDLARAEGAIINVTSDAGVEAYEGWGAYGTTKAALEQLSHVLAAEEPGVRVWWLDPGDMRTAMHQAAFPGEDISDRPLPEAVVPAVRRLLRTRPPSGRIVAADLLEVAR